MSERTNPTVLIIDDDPDIRESLTELLSEEGYGVRSARDGLEALELLREGLRPSVILLDLMMPRMDGFRFREEQLRLPDAAAVPVVVVTAGGRAERGRVVADAWVTKPLRVEELLACVARLCHASSAMRRRIRDGAE